MRAIAMSTVRHAMTDAAVGVVPESRLSELREGPNEIAWRAFRQRLLRQIETNEWSSAKPQEVVAGVVDMAHHALAASSCTMFLPNGYGYGVYYRAGQNDAGRQITQARCDRLSRPAAWVIQHGAALVLNDAQDWSTLPSDCGNEPPGNGARVLCVPVTASGHVIGAIEVNRHPTEPPFDKRDVDTARFTGATAGMSIENTRLRESVEEGYRSTIRALASAIDAKDPYTCGHSQTVAQYALVTGMVLSLSIDDMQILENAALLHDIGKIGIDDAILRKPRRLTPSERAVVRDHPVIGAAIIHEIVSLREVSDLVLHHHEAFDGSGYPHGLCGNQIPLGARIVAVADAFDSMTTNRPYRGAMTINEAMQELLRCRGTQFCPQALDAFAVGFTRYYDDLPQRHRVLRGPAPVPIGG